MSKKKAPPAQPTKKTQVPFPVADLTNAQIAFASNITNLMPKYCDIPNEFKDLKNHWVRIADRWFSRGIDGAEFIPKNGTDCQKAIRHLSCLMSSFTPKHEEKIAAIAYLMSQWFDAVKLIA